MFFFLVRGGFNEVYRKAWEAKNNTDQKMFFFDMISAYAFAAMFWLPVGKIHITFI